MNKKGIGFKGMVTAVMLIVLFIFFMSNFIISFLSETNPSSELLTNTYGFDNSSVNAKDLMEDFRSKINLQKDELGNSQVSPTEYLFLIAGAMFTIPKAVFGFVVNGIMFIPNLIFKGLGGTGAGDLLSFGLTMVIAIMVITLIILTIRLIRTGDSGDR